MMGLIDRIIKWAAEKRGYILIEETMYLKASESMYEIGQRYIEKEVAKAFGVPDDLVKPKDAYPWFDTKEIIP